MDVGAVVALPVETRVATPVNLPVTGEPERAADQPDTNETTTLPASMCCQLASESSVHPPDASASCVIPHAVENNDAEALTADYDVTNEQTIVHLPTTAATAVSFGMIVASHMKIPAEPPPARKIVSEELLPVAVYQNHDESMTAHISTRHRADKASVVTVSIVSHVESTVPLSETRVETQPINLSADAGLELAVEQHGLNDEITPLVNCDYSPYLLGTGATSTLRVPGSTQEPLVRDARPNRCARDIEKVNSQLPLIHTPLSKNIAQSTLQARAAERVSWLEAPTPATEHPTNDVRLILFKHTNRRAGWHNNKPSVSGTERRQSDDLKSESNDIRVPPKGTMSTASKQVRPVANDRVHRDCDF